MKPFYVRVIRMNGSQLNWWCSELSEAFDVFAGQVRDAAKEQLREEEAFPLDWKGRNIREVSIVGVMPNGSDGTEYGKFRVTGFPMEFRY